MLVVDDSLTVRELERKMIEGHGYTVDVAVDGMDGWNAVRAGTLRSRRHGRRHAAHGWHRARHAHQAGCRSFATIPVMIVSYKDRDEDRRRGLDAGADYYLTKGSFYDETMLRAIEDFIGVARENRDRER